jgi:hypothetical protein
MELTKTNNRQGKPRHSEGHRTTYALLRPQSLDKAYMRVIATLPRRGRIIRQVHRALIAHGGKASMRELRHWAYLGKPRQHWHHISIYRALHWLGARRIGWGMYATRVRHDK